MANTNLSTRAIVGRFLLLLAVGVVAIVALFVYAHSRHVIIIQ